MQYQGGGAVVKSAVPLLESEAAKREGWRMDRTTVQRSLEVWLFIAVASTMNGMFRSLFLVPRLGDHMAHVLSVLILIIVVLLSSSVLVNRILREYVNSDLFLIGILWVVLSVSVDRKSVV
jgi:hypothetical protein